MIEIPASLKRNDPNLINHLQEIVKQLNDITIEKQVDLSNIHHDDTANTKEKNAATSLLKKSFKTYLTLAAKFINIFQEAYPELNYKKNSFEDVYTNIFPDSATPNKPKDFSAGYLELLRILNSPESGKPILT